MSDDTGIYIANPTAMQDRQQRKLRASLYGAQMVAIEDPITGRPNGTFSNGINRSGTAGTASSTLAPANASRKGLNIQNISSNVIGINEVGGVAAIGSPGTYTVPAGASINVRTADQVNVIASAANSAYTATETQ